METVSTPIATPQSIVDAVMNEGSLDALEGYVQLKRMERELENALASLKGKAMERAATYGKGEHEAYGAIIQCKSGAGRWDFKNCSWYANIEAMRKAKEEQAKAAWSAQQRMQPIPVDLETGEQIEPAVYVAGAETISISLPKK